MLKKPDIFGPNVKRAREAQGLAIHHLAISTGLPAEVIAMIETGQKRPAGVVMVRLAQALGVTLQFLLLPGGEESEDCTIVPKPWHGLEECQFCDRVFHPMPRWTLGNTRIFMCDEKECQNRAWEAGFEPRPDLTPKR